MNAPIAVVNGEFVPLSRARVSVLDRGFLFADGVYEVIAAYGGKAFALDGHLRRLERSLRELALPNPHSAARWRELVGELVKRNGGGEQSIYLQVTRGAADKRSAAFPADTPPTVIGFCQALPAHAPELLARGVAALTAPDIRWGRCDIKSVALLPNVLAIQSATAQQCNEAIFHRDGRVTEGASSNVLAVLGGEIVTPPLSHEILPGVTREVLLDALRGAGQPVTERALPLSELRAADEVWLVSTVREVLPVTTLDGAAVGNGQPGPAWRRAWETFQQCKRQNA